MNHSVATSRCCLTRGKAAEDWEHSFPLIFTDKDRGKTCCLVVSITSRNDTSKAPD